MKSLVLILSLVIACPVFAKGGGHSGGHSVTASHSTTKASPHGFSLFGRPASSIFGSLLGHKHKPAIPRQLEAKPLKH